LARLQELIESQCWTLGSKNSHNSQFLSLKTIHSLTPSRPHWQSENGSFKDCPTIF
jgi:hypothetical protein